MPRFGGIPVDEPTGGRFGGIAVEDIPEKKKKPGLLSRSLEALQIGASDALSTITGDTYGRNGDPTQRDDLGYVGKRVKALGGDIIPAVGNVVADAAIAAGKAVLPEGVQQTIGNTAQAVMQSAPAQVLGKGLDKWKQASPETYATAGEVANIATSALPVKTPPINTNAAAKLARTMASKRAAETLTMLEPEAKDLFKSGTNTIKPGILGKTEFIPNQKYGEMIDEVVDVPGVNPRRSYTRNKEAIQTEVNTVRDDLRGRLSQSPPVDKGVVDKALQDARFNFIGESNSLGVSNTKTIDKFQNLADTMINNKLANRQLVNGKIVGELSPQDILDVRVEFDQAAKTKFPKVFEKKGTEAASAAAAVRDSLNNVLEQSAPGAKQDLTRMHRLLKANTLMEKRAAREGRNRISRFLGNLERSTGVKHPSNPISVTRTLTDLPSALLVGSLALTKGTGRFVGERAAMESVAAQELLAKALRNSPEVLGKSAAIAAMNRKKEEDYAP